MIHYHSLNDYCKETFGCKLYKLSLDGGMTCPNRDGTIGTGGCIFCSEDGSGDFAEKPCGNITEQIEKAKLRVAHKNKNGRYIAYFQSYTNTYAPVSYLEKIFTEAISHPDIEVLSVATRPDCISDEVIDLIDKLNKEKPVWIELGFQSSNEKSIKYIRRGYENSVFADTVKKLSSINVKVVAHIIIGLPGETETDMKNSVKYVCDSGVWGIKLQLLHVLKNTDLAKDFENGRFKVLSKDEYLSIVCNLLNYIPEDIVIHRLTGDGDKKKLIAPLWSADKKDVLNSLNAKLKNENICQGINIL